MEQSIKYKREDLVKKFIEVQEPPSALVKAFEKPPFCHMLSTYVIRPVACDQLPFVIHHKNKQPVLLQQKQQKPRPRQNEKGKEVLNFESDGEKEAEDQDDDDEFETVRADKKRGAHQKKPVAEPPAADPRFPASDPSKVKVITVT
jgi:hypothetical protein